MPRRHRFARISDTTWRPRFGQKLLLTRRNRLQWCNLRSNHHQIGNRTSAVIAHLTKDRVQTWGRRPVRKFRGSLPRQLSTIGSRTRYASAEVNENNKGCFYLEVWKPGVNGNLAIGWWLKAGTSGRSQEKSTNRLRKTNYTFWMLFTYPTL